MEREAFVNAILDEVIFNGIDGLVAEYIGYENIHELKKVLLEEQDQYFWSYISIISGFLKEARA